MINVIGNIFDSSGYSVHTRELVNALSKHVNVKLISSMPPNWERYVTDKELEMIKEKEFDVNLIITNPVYWRVNCNAKRNWVYLVWEGDKIPDSFMEECSNPEIEYIFVPSNHTLQAVINKVGEGKAPKWIDKIKIMHHGVDLSKFYPKNRKHDKFTFIANKGLRNLEDRGGIQYLVEAFIAEFDSEENVRLNIKINPAYGIPNMQMLINDISKKVGKDKIAEIKFMTDLVNYESLVNFYNDGDVFVSPTRAEAFNLGCIEAMACGKPVITTNFGGQTDYTTFESSWIIGGKLEEVKHDVIYEGIRWLTPDIKELRNALREAYSKGYDVSKKGLKSLEIARTMSWDNTAKNITNLLYEYL